MANDAPVTPRDRARGREASVPAGSPIDLSIDSGVAVVTLCRPPVNAIDDAWVSRFDQILDTIEADARIKVLWIRSAQRAFCAGADLDFMRERFADAAGRSAMIAFTRRLQQLYARIERSPKVSVAEIGGAALGGGFELALACDIRVASERARLGLPEVRLGLLPAAGGTQRMTRICGEALARRLILGAEVVTGADAVALGLVQWQAPEAELRALTCGVVDRIADLPGEALLQSKRCIAAALDRADDGYEIELDASATLLALAQTQDLVRQFLDKSA